MPRGINGRETYEEIIKICPGQKAIIASGFAETGEVKKAQRLGAGKYIKKPYTLQKLAVAAKEELARQGHRNGKNSASGSNIQIYSENFSKS